jgi:tetratricopeptide (TPR) repeat protein
LKAAGALQQSTSLYEEYLAGADQESAKGRAEIAYSLAKTYLEIGEFERALRWFYEAESLGGVASADLGPKIVHTLERLGKYHAAQAALEARSQLGADQVQRAADDPVVGRIGEEKIYRSEFIRALDDLPPEIAQSFRQPGAQQEYLKKFVADELLWRKAKKLETDEEPEVLRQHALMLKQLTIAKFVEEEIVGKIDVAEDDLQNFFEANRSRYEEPATEGKNSSPKELAEVRSAVERDYRLGKIQGAYQAVIDAEMLASDVELFPENLGGVL